MTGALSKWIAFAAIFAGIAMWVYAMMKLAGVNIP